MTHDVGGGHILPTQHFAARWIAEKGTRYLADEMRVGKTAAVIRACDLLAAKRVLWLTTGAARLGHAYAWQQFSPLDRDCRVIMTGRDSISDSGVTITSYDLAVGPLFDELVKNDFDALCLDEAHKLKNHKAKRTKAVLGERCDRVGGIAERCEHVIPMSGTPAPNHPGELWPILHALFPQSIVVKGDKPLRQFEFERRYCKTKWTPFGNNMKIVGGKNLPDLRARMAPYFLRRKFKDIYHDAAGVHIEMLYVDAAGELDDLRELERDEVLVGFKRALELATTDKQRDLINTEIEKTVGLRLRRLTGKAKVPGVVAWAKELLEDRGGKLALYGHHSEVLDGLVEGLSKYRPLRVSGGVSPKAKAEAEQVFREDAKRRVFVGNIQAAGEAIDLSVADDIVLVESSWVPGENDQAIKRIMNMAKQRENVAWFATLADSIDEHIQRTNARKTSDLVQLFG